MRKEDWRALFESFGTRTKTAVLRHQEIENDLLIGSPISAVGKDKDGFDFSFAEVSGAGMLVFFFSKFAEWGSVLIVFDDVARGYNIFEAVAFGDLTALLALASNDENGVVPLSHFPHGGVAADELAGRNFHLELLAELHASFLLSLTATVCDKNIWSE
jgi:hypothetical protein